METKLLMVEISEQLFDTLYQKARESKGSRKSLADEVRTYVEIALTKYLDELEEQIK
jgi:hypothetical protein